MLSPTHAQPLMYKQIKKHEKVVEKYARKLIESSICTGEDYQVCVCVCVRACL